MAPEQLDGTLTNKVDIWAFGCVILEMVTGRCPYHLVSNELTICSKMFNGCNPLKYYCE